MTQSREVLDADGGATSDEVIAHSYLKPGLEYVVCRACSSRGSHLRLLLNPLPNVRSGHSVHRQCTELRADANVQICDCHARAGLTSR